MLAGELLAKEQPDYKANKKAIHAQLEAQARDLLAQMGLSERAGHYPHQLSGGQQQRVAIARALALHPDILCFDEPTSALDPELTGEVLRVLRDLADRKTTMIIVTHEMHFARDVADRILFMDGGVVVEEGPARQLIDHPGRSAPSSFWRTTLNKTGYGPPRSGGLFAYAAHGQAVLRTTSQALRASSPSRGASGEEDRSPGKGETFRYAKASPTRRGGIAKQ